MFYNVSTVLASHILLTVPNPLWKRRRSKSKPDVKDNSKADEEYNDKEKLISLIQLRA
jgi:hypothetical protein